MSNPRQGATGQPLSTRVGFTFSGNVDFGSVGAESFIVRPAGGGPLAGKYSAMVGASVVNFTPDAPLQANTTYEALLVAGGIKDWAGNRVPRDTVIHFSTGASVSLRPAWKRDHSAAPAGWGLQGMAYPASSWQLFPKPHLWRLRPRRAGRPWHCESGGGARGAPRPGRYIREMAPSQPDIHLGLTRVAYNLDKALGG